MESRDTGLRTVQSTRVKGLPTFLTTIQASSSTNFPFFSSANTVFASADKQMNGKYNCGVLWRLGRVDCAV